MKSRKILKPILDFFFPQKCLGCKKENEILCEKCLAGINYPDVPESSGVFAASNYGDELIKQAIWMLKYRGIKQLAAPLAELIIRRVSSKIKLENPLIIPVPVSKKKLRERGYNQAELIAQHLIAKKGRPPSDRPLNGLLAANILIKKIHTESQVLVKNREKRLGNVVGSFEIKNANLLNGRNLILIDDVCTTGATIKEAKRILKQSGAKKVIAVVVARG